MCISGVVIIFISFPNTVVNSEVKASVEDSKVSFELKTGIPGIVLVVLGALGLLTLLIKIPVKQAFRVMDHSRSNQDERFLGLMTDTLLTRLEYREFKLPLFLFWIFRKNLNLLK